MVDKKHKGHRSKILDLPWKQDIDDRLTSGESPAKVAKWLIDEKGMSDSLTGLKKSIERYRASTIPEAALIHPAVLAQKLEGVECKVNEIHKYEELLVTQELRTNMAVELEKQVGTLLPGTLGELKFQSDLLAGLVKLKQDLGIYQKAQADPPPINMAVFNQSNTTVVMKEALNNVPPERRREALDAVRGVIMGVLDSNRRDGSLLGT